MGTNYYVEAEIGDACPVCKHRKEIEKELHIGKSSRGWCFALHSIPELGLTNWHNWQVFLKDKSIKNEYREQITLDELSDIVLNRSRTPCWDHPPLAYTSWEKFHELNHSMEGPNGMIRSARNDGHGGDEPWDLYENEFC